MSLCKLDPWTHRSSGPCHGPCIKLFIYLVLLSTVNNLKYKVYPTGKLEVQSTCYLRSNTVKVSTHLTLSLFETGYGFEYIGDVPQRL